MCPRFAYNSPVHVVAHKHLPTTRTLCVRAPHTVKIQIEGLGRGSILQLQGTPALGNPAPARSRSWDIVPSDQDRTWARQSSLPLTPRLVLPIVATMHPTSSCSEHDTDKQFSLVVPFTGHTTSKCFRLGSGVKGNSFLAGSFDALWKHVISTVEGDWPRTSLVL